MRRLLAASAVALSVVAPFSAYAATDNYSFSNGGGNVSGEWFNSCELVVAQVFVSRAGTHNLNNPSTAGVILINFSIENFCTSSYLSEYAYATNFQFDAPGAASGIPQSIKASGTAPAICTQGCSSTDTVTFSIALQSIGASASEDSMTNKFTASGVTTDEHMDMSFVPATGTVTISSANLGTLPISNWFAILNDEKIHTISISH